MATYLCNDGNAEIEITADTPQAAAQEYVDGGEWGEITETDWVTVRVTEITSAMEFVADHDDDDDISDEELVKYFRLVYDREPDDGDRKDGLWSLICAGVDQPDSRSIKIALEPDEPECEDGADHDWQSPVEIVGGCSGSPGVYGHGGGVIITSVCLRCGTERVSDTWAQDSGDGEQGLESVSYEVNKYAEEVAGLVAAD
jgi:hypothetical protein